MSLSDGEVAALAEQAAELLPVPTDVRVAPAISNDPYGLRPSTWWTVTFRPSGGGVIQHQLTGNESPLDALRQLVDTLGNDAAEQPGMWGVPVPGCPGHVHPADADTDGPDVVLVCPETRQIVRRIRPA